MDVDLLALPQCLGEVESFSYDPDYGREPHLTVIGKKGRREVVIEVYFEPFEDVYWFSENRNFAFETVAKL